MESGIFGLLMKNWIDSAKKIRGSPKFAVRGQTDSSVRFELFEEKNGFFYYNPYCLLNPCYVRGKLRTQATHGNG